MLLQKTINADQDIMVRFRFPAFKLLLVLVSLGQSQGFALELGSSICGPEMAGLDYLIAPLLEVKSVDLSVVKTSEIEYVAKLRDKSGTIKDQLVSAKLVIPDSSSELGKFAKSLDGNSEHPHLNKEIFVVVADFESEDLFYDGVFLKDSQWKELGLTEPLRTDHVLFLHTGQLKGKMFLIVRSHETFHGYANYHREQGEDGKYYDAVFWPAAGKQLPFASAHEYPYLMSVEELHTNVKDLLRQSFLNHHRNTLQLIDEQTRAGVSVKLKYSSIVYENGYQFSFRHLNGIVESQINMLKSIQMKYEEMAHPTTEATEPPLDLILGDETGKLSSNWEIRTSDFTYQMRNIPKKILDKIQADSNEINLLSHSTKPEDLKKIEADSDEINELISGYLQGHVQELLNKNLEVQKDLHAVDKIIRNARIKGYFNPEDYHDLKEATARLGLSVIP